MQFHLHLRKRRCWRGCLAMSSQNVLTAYARQSLYGFTAQACTILDQDAEFIPHWLNRAVHLRLKRVEVGINTRLLLDVPYSHHNCLLAGIGRMAWSIGQTPARRMLVVLHNVDCAEDFMEELARLLASPWYWRVFPGVQVFQYGERELRTSANSRLVITYVHGELPRGTVDQITLFKAVRVLRLRVGRGRMRSWGLVSAKCSTLAELGSGFICDRLQPAVRA